MNKRGLLILIAFVAFMGYVIYLFNAMGSQPDHAQHEGKHEPINWLPSWQGMRQDYVIGGEQALKEINQLHGKSVGVHEGYKAKYSKDGESVTFWVAVVANESEARKLTADMTGKIGNANQVFSQPKEMKIGDFTAFETRGIGLENYYYYKGSAVYWVGINSPRQAQLIPKILTDF